MPFLYAPPVPSLEDIATGKAQVSNRKLLAIIKALAEKIDSDTGISAADFVSTVEEKLGG